MTKQEIGSFISTERQRQKLSQTALAQKAGINNYHVVIKIEKDKGDYQVSTLFKLVKALGCTIVITPIKEQKTSEENTQHCFDMNFKNVECAKNEISEPIKIPSKKKPVSTIWKR